MKYHIKPSQLAPSRRERGCAVSQPVGTLGLCATSYLYGIGLPEDTRKNASISEINRSLMAATAADAIFRETDIQQEPAALSVRDFYIRVKQAADCGMLAGIRASIPAVPLDANAKDREAYVLQQSLYLYAEVYIRIVGSVVRALAKKKCHQEMVDYILLSALSCPKEWADGPRVTRWSQQYCRPPHGTASEWYDLVQGIHTMLKSGDTQALTAARIRLEGPANDR